MCCCGKPTINGTMGYRWQPGDKPINYPVNAPDVPEDATILYDEPGRCGGIDAHSHHYRVVKELSGVVFLYVRHGGDEHLMMSAAAQTIMGALANMDSDARYWILSMMYHLASHAAWDAREKESGIWRKAAAEKRIKMHRQPRSTAVRVWIEPVESVADVAVVGS